MLKDFISLFKRKRKPTKSIFMIPNQYGNQIGLYVEWEFPADEKGIPIFNSDSAKAKLEMPNGTYSIYFNKITINAM